MAADETILNLGVDSSGVKSANATLGDFVRAGKAAEHQAQLLDEVLSNAGKGGGKAINEYIAKLKIQAAQLGSTATQQKLIGLAAAGATVEQIRQAKAIHETIDAFHEKERAALAAEKATTKDAGSRGVAAIAKGAAIGTIIGQGIGFASRQIISLIGHFEELTRSASVYKDLEEAFGGSAESFAAIDVAAKVAGTTVNEVANFTAKLTRGLAGVEDETKNAGAGLIRLGIDVNKFKTLEPVAQLEILGKALAKFKDGQAKTEIIGDLGGRGAARILPFLKELNEEGGRNVVITQLQIDQADAYKDAQARAFGTLDQYLKLIALQALPAITAFTGGLIDLAKDVLGVDKATGMLKNNHAVTDWAYEAVGSLADFLDFLRTAGEGLITFGSTISSTFARAKLAVKFSTAGPGAAIDFLRGKAGDLKDAYQEAEEATDKNSRQIEKFLEMDTSKFGNAVRARIAEQRKLNAAIKEGDDRPGLDKRDAKTKRTKGAPTDKNTLDSEIRAVRDALKTVTSEVKDNEAILEAAHSAGILEDTDYYALKLSLLRRAGEAEVEELQVQNNLYMTFLSQRKGTDKERLDVQEKLNENTAEIGRKQEALATKEFVLDIQRRSSLDQLAHAYADARIAAQQFYDTQAKGHERELAALGQGDLARRQADGRNQVADRYQQQRQDLERNKQLLELDDKFTNTQRVEYEKRLALINEFEGKALTEWEDYYVKLRAKETDASIGFSDALNNYADQAGFTAKNTEEVTTRAFKGMEDAITTFATTGKLSFKSMIDSFVADIIRLTVQQELIKPIANYLTGSTSGGTSTSGTGLVAQGIGYLAGLFGGGGSSAPTGYASLAGISGGRAIGGPVSPNGMYRVNEGGKPEVLSIAGRKYLMTGKDRGDVEPASTQQQAARPIGITINQMFAPGTDRRTTDQAAAAASQQLRRASRIT